MIVCELQKKLDAWSAKYTTSTTPSPFDTTMSNAVAAMRTKYDKYCGEAKSKHLLEIAHVLDPQYRFKYLRGVEFGSPPQRAYSDDIIAKIKARIRSIYTRHYMSEQNIINTSTSSNNQAATVPVDSMD